MRDNIYDIFTPGAEVKSIEKFAGRTEQLDHLSEALQTQGSHIVIYGSYGVGKSSLARQLVSLSEGHTDTISRLSINPIKNFDFLPIMVKADDSIENISQLLIRILTSNDALAPWIPMQLHERATTLSGGAKAGFLGVSVGGEGASDSTYTKQEVGKDVVSIFFNALDVILKSGVAESGVLIVIDEFDRIRDATGFASIVKSCEGRKVVFGIVGISDDVENLLHEHASIGRQIATGSVLVPPMTYSEMREVFLNAHERLSNQIVFDEKAIKYISTCARGHPYLIHLIGRQALITAAKNKKVRISEIDAKQAVTDIALQGTNIALEATYRKAIRSSPIREHILKKFAERQEEIIRTTELYEEISKEIEVERESLSQYVGHLQSAEYGGILKKAGERYYKFNDAVFKAYAAARPYELSRR